jgi:hypothetical protein
MFGRKDVLKDDGEGCKHTAYLHVINALSIDWTLRTL